MREIKFKTYHSEAKRMSDRAYSWEMVMRFGHKEFIPLQYTGLKDTNGKEIYEGDIIQLEGSPISYSIEWNKYQWAINDHGALGYDPDWNIQPFNHCVYERAIVVGNIFENSDLLKQ